MRGRAAGKARGSKLGSRDKRTCTQSAALSLTVTWPQFSHSVRWGHSSAYLVRSGQGSQGLLSAKSLPQGQGGGWRAQGSGDAVPAITIKDMFQTLSLVGSCSYKYTLEFTHSILRWAGCEPPFTGDAGL